jgi:transcriptional regulator NrdR family protein
VLETREVKFRGLFLKVRVRECRNCKYHFRTKEITDDNIIFSNKDGNKARVSKSQADNGQNGGGFRKVDTARQDQLDELEEQVEKQKEELKLKVPLEGVPEVRTRPPEPAKKGGYRKKGLSSPKPGDKPNTYIPPIFPPS